MRPIIREVEEVLDAIGFPLDRMPNKAWAARFPKVILALGSASPQSELSHITGWPEDRSIYGSRMIIGILNGVWDESIGLGSYDEVRRKCVQYIEEAGIFIKNPDNPERATNSPASGFALSPEAASLLKAYGTETFETEKARFLRQHGSLRNRLAQEREIGRIPVVVNDSVALDLQPGKHNELQREIIHSFLPVFAPGSELVYFADADSRRGYLNEQLADSLNLFELKRDKLPDVIAYLRSKNWVLLIEAVASSGHISELRKSTLDRLLVECSASPIYVSAFPDRATMRRFLSDIAWETEVWISDDPTHIIHFDGEKFLGPY